MKKQSIYKNWVMAGTLLLLPFSNIHAGNEILLESPYKSIVERQEFSRTDNGIFPESPYEGIIERQERSLTENDGLSPNDGSKGDALGTPIGDALPYLLLCSLVYGAFLCRQCRNE
jgi:hypothetical protein